MGFNSGFKGLISMFVLTFYFNERSSLGALSCIFVRETNLTRRTQTRSVATYSLNIKNHITQLYQVSQVTRYSYWHTTLFIIVTSKCCRR